MSTPIASIAYSFFQIYTQGCIPRIQSFVEQNLYVVGGIALGIAVAQLLGQYEPISRGVASLIVSLRLQSSG